MNNINDYTEKTCIGCGICSTVCTKKAIEMQNISGFYVPSIDEKKCINCGLCKQSCSKYSSVLNTNKAFKIYSAFSKDVSLLKKSSSGGVATEVFRWGVENGYKIFACEFDVTNDSALHGIACNKEELDKFCGSKYMQSKFWCNINEVLLDSSKYIIIGTPCQIYAFDKVARIKNMRERFFFIDFFCHGTPSKLIWDATKNVEEKKYGMLKNVTFRSKEFKWHEFVNKKEYIKKTVIKKSDMFYKLFFSDKLLNDACYHCDYRQSYDCTDMRIGDFWGNEYDTNGKGVSLVCVCSKKAEMVFEKISNNMVVKEFYTNAFEKAQSIGYNNKRDDKLKLEMIELLKANDANGAYRRYYKSISLKNKLLVKGKSFVKMLPYSMVAKLRKVYHKHS